MKLQIYSICFCLLVSFALASSANAAGQNPYTVNSNAATSGRASYGNYVATNRSIKSMPLLNRPDRPGHFIGNSIRRAYRRRYGR